MESIVPFFVFLVGVVFVFFVFASLALWLKTRKEIQERQMLHAERMKALELGQPLQEGEIARAEVEGKRVGAAAAVGILVPLIAVGGAFAVTYLLSQTYEMYFRDVVSGIWIGCGVIVLVTVILTLRFLRRHGPRVRQEESPPSAGERFADERTAVTPKPSSRL